MQFLNDPGDLDRSVGVRQPVQIDPVDQGIIFLNGFLYVEMDIFEHSDGQVDDPASEPRPLEEFRDGREPNRIHFEDRGGRNQV